MSRGQAFIALYGALIAVDYGTALTVRYDYPLWLAALIILPSFIVTRAVVNAGFPRRQR